MKKAIALFFAISLFILSISGQSMATGTLAKNIYAITADDCQTSTILLIQIVDEFGFKVTLFVIAGRIGEYGYITSYDLKSFYANGHEMGNHTWDHEDFSKINGFEIVDTINLANEKFKEWGFSNVICLAPPYGELPVGLEDLLVDTPTKVCRRAYPKESVETAVNLVRTFDPMEVEVFSLKKSTIGTDPSKVSAILSDVGSAYPNENKLTVIVVHNIGDDDDEYTTSEPVFRSVLEHIFKQVINGTAEVKTLGQSYELMMAAKKDQVTEITPDDEDDSTDIDDNTGTGDECSEPNSENNSSVESSSSSSETSNIGNTSTVTEVSTPETKTEAVSGSSESKTEIGDVVSKSETTTDEEGEEDVAPPENVVATGDSGGDSGGGCFISSFMN